jgi:hypothetical protein
MDEKDSQLEVRSRELFAESVTHLDAATRSRLTRARHAALSAAALLVALVLWTNLPRQAAAPVSADNPPALEDIDIVASNEELDLLEDDIEFYRWAEQAPESIDGGMG